MLKKADSQCKIKAPYEYFFYLSQFHKKTSEAAVRRCSSK